MLSFAEIKNNKNFSNISPELPSKELITKELIKAKKHMVVSANPYASQIGLKILKKGGSAIDAAIAMQMVLNLVEPQSSGIGGGGFLLYFNEENKKIFSYDGRETLPENTPYGFFEFVKDRETFFKAVNSGLAVGTPGLLKMLEKAHSRHGLLPWKTLFEDAIRLSEMGFKVSPRLNTLISKNKNLYLQKEAREYFFPNNVPLPIGYNLKNLELASTFKKIANSSSKVFYNGEIANKIVKSVEKHKQPGFLSIKDLNMYKSIERKPFCKNYKKYKICGMGPPSSGAITIFQILGILKQYEIEKMEPNSLRFVHYFSEAGRLAYADRKKYLSDPDFSEISFKSLVDQKYLNFRGSLINKNISMKKAKPGNPFGELKLLGNDHSPELPSTTHLVVVDKFGNGVSLTSSIESAFGSKIFVDGFLLNNQLTDFSFRSKDNKGNFIENRPEALKRPLSSMSPTIVTKNGELFLLIGSPGGKSIINFVAKNLIAILDWNLNIQDAINLPNLGSRNRATELEKNTMLEKLKSKLESMGHPVRLRSMTSGTHGILINSDGLTGGSDPRREGLALGE